MYDTWVLIGKCCSDSTFVNDLVNSLARGDTNLNRAKILYDFLWKPRTPQLRFSRWEIMDINRFFNSIERYNNPVNSDQKGQVRHIADVWGATPKDEAVLAVFGAACIDTVLLGVIETKTPTEIFWYFINNPPRIRLDDDETKGIQKAKALKDLLAVNAGNKSVLARMKGIESAGWVIGRTGSCASGVVHSDYEHPDTPKIAAMMKFEPLRALLTEDLEHFAQSILDSHLISDLIESLEAGPDERPSSGLLQRLK